jgi:hypothetical protein
MRFMFFLIYFLYNFIKFIILFCLQSYIKYSDLVLMFYFKFAFKIIMDFCLENCVCSLQNVLVLGWSSICECLLFLVLLNKI